MWRKLFDVGFWLGLSLYFGGMVVIGAIVAPAVFDAAKDAQISMPGIASPPLDVSLQAGGEIFGVILNRFAYLEAAALLLILIGIADRIFTQRNVRGITWLIALCWLCVALVTAYDAAAVRPRVWNQRDALRQTAAAHAHDAAGTAWPEHAEFDALHARSETLGKTKACLLLAMVLLGAWRGSGGRAISGPRAPGRRSSLTPPPGNIA